MSKQATSRTIVKTVLYVPVKKRGTTRGLRYEKRLLKPEDTVTFLDEKSVTGQRLVTIVFSAAAQKGIISFGRLSPTHLKLEFNRATGVPFHAIHDALIQLITIATGFGARLIEETDEPSAAATYRLLH